MKTTAVLLFTIICSVAVSAQSGQLPWHVVDNGGGVSNAGGITLRTSIGQIAHEASGGSGDGIQSGYIPGVRPLSGTSTTVGVALEAGWNMVSVPLLVDDYRVSTLFPGSASGAFGYSDGYTPTSLLQTGAGYWLKTFVSGSADISGSRLLLDTIPVTAGWNMIGALSLPIPVDGINGLGTALLTPFFGYANAYQIADSLYPGSAYWIRVSQNGKLVLNAGSALALPSIAGGPKEAGGISRGSGSTAQRKDEPNRLVVREATGKKEILYFSGALPGGIDQRQYSLPPSPPEGTFDVRFASNRSMEAAGIDGIREYPIEIASAHYPVTIAWELNRSDRVASIKIGEKEIPLKVNGSALISSPDAPVRLVLSSSSGPKDFALEQNYPNPFNPSMTIRYQLPVDSRVSMKMYNTLGQLVQVLSEGSQAKGFKSIEWNAGALPGGVYFYRLEAVGLSGTPKTFTQVKKAVLLR